MTLRQSFVSTLSRLMREEENLVLLLGDISTFAFRGVFEKHASRCLNLGVCEQGSVGFAAGLSMAGFYPVYHTIDSFMVRRAFEQLYLDFGVQGLPGLFISVGGASDYVKLGPTHQCGHGPLLMRQVPGLRQYHPLTEDRVASSIEYAVRNRELAYVRIEESARLARFDPNALLEGVDGLATVAP